MILLDTNVLSALMLPAPNPVLVAWMDRQMPERLWTTSVTVFELWNGVRRLPVGARRRALEAGVSRLLHADLLGERVAPLDRAAAEAAAMLAARRATEGRPVDLADTLIAGIALARRAGIATRNVRHFEGLDGVTVIDPFAA